MSTQINAQKKPFFVCEYCDFKCSKESNYKLHIETIKHKRVTESNKKMPNMGKQNFSCICGNSYMYRPGLAKHKRNCLIFKSSKKECEDINSNNGVVSENKIEEKVDTKTDKELKDLVKELIK